MLHNIVHGRPVEVGQHSILMATVCASDEADSVFSFCTVPKCTECYCPIIALDESELLTYNEDFAIKI